MTDTEGDGYVTAWPCGSARPLASNLNYVRGETVANLVVARAGTNGSVCLYSSAAVDLVADLAGWFPATSPVNVGVPSRVLDTRATSKPSADGVVAIQLPPSLRGVVLNLTAVDADRPGYVTAWPCDRPQPTASNLNYVPGRVAASIAFVAPAADGRVCLYTYASAHLVADLDASFAGAEPVLVPGNRIVDTRIGLGTRAFFPGSGLLMQIANGTTAPSESAAVILNVTATEAVDDGYITVWPCDQPMPPTSNVNSVRLIDRAAVVLAKPSAFGTICFMPYGHTSMVVDVDGWFLSGFVAVSPVRLADTRSDPSTL